MSDYDSSLPVRTENNGDVVVKVGDGTTPSQQLSIDSSGRALARITATNGNSLTDTGGSLNVNMTNSLSVGVTDSAAFTYGSSPELTIGGVFQDTSPTITAGKTGAVRITALRGLHSNLRDSSGNELLGSKASANSIPVVIASDQGAVPVSQSGTWTVTSNQGTAASVGNAWPTSPTVGGAVVSATNPFPVYFQDGGTSVNDYNTAAALAAAGTSNHDYTVTALKTLHLGQIHAAASGKLKIEVQVESGVATGSFATKFVGFNSTANPDVDLSLAAPIQVAAGVRVRVIRTNNDKAAMDVYSTISGHEQ
jgi:hypothetical protein